MLLRRDARSYAIARLEAADAVPDWAAGAGLSCVARGGGELSILAAEERVPADVRAERGFRAWVIAGPVPFETVGLLARLTGALAGEGVSVLAVSTFDTDWILVRRDDADRAEAAFAAAGFDLA